MMGCAFRVHKSLCKFEYVYTTLLQSLFVHGFCREPKESEEEGGPVRWVPYAFAKDLLCFSRVILYFSFICYCWEVK